MRLLSYRRRLALMICPELAHLPHAAAEAPVRKPISEASAVHASQIRQLDHLYATHTGIVLDAMNAPDYSGPMYEWRSSRGVVRGSVVNVLIRLRRDRICGVRTTMRFRALNYFASIWPAGLA